MSGFWAVPSSAVGMLPQSLGLTQSRKRELCFGLHQPLLVLPSIYTSSSSVFTGCGGVMAGPCPPGRACGGTKRPPLVW